ncbi:unnamed protein product [Parnassius apollo]|uniref:(apollo) hypothetical protein n=1 Tax=Parnassius apollo TaxID=110799 RepID=A0A8S3XBX9_PARAO|nr:unnamed protein product [Parnassius apollo]
MRTRLVLNGLTAEVGESRAGPPASPEPYHELELYRQLLALPRRALTPDPEPPPREVTIFHGKQKLRINSWYTHMHANYRDVTGWI